MRKLFNSSEPGFILSASLHAAVLGAALLTLSSAHFPEAQEGIAVEVFSDAQFSQITKGETTAKQVPPTPKPRVDRVAEKIEERALGAEQRDTPAPPKRPAEVAVADKEEDVAAKPLPPPPPTRTAPPEETKKDETEKLIEQAQAEALAQQKAAEAKAKVEAETKARQEAEAKAKAKALADAAKAEAEAKRVAEAKAQAEAEAKARKEAELAKKIDLGDIRQFLNTKDKNQSTGATGQEVQKTASIGTATGTSAKLNPNMMAALRGIMEEQIKRCYLTPPGALQASGVTLPILDIRFNVDGSLADAPHIVKVGPTGLDRSVAEAAVRAVRQCAPYNIPAKFAPYYEEWKKTIVEFDVLT